LLSDIKPGYVGYVRSSGTMGKLIRFGEAISSGRGDVNHMVIFGNDGKVIQAEMKGVTYDATYQDVLDHDICYVIKPPKQVNLKKVVEFGEFYVGTEYGLWTDIGIGIDMVTWNWVPSFRGARKDSIICSALGSEALRFGGWLHHWTSIYTVTPQQSLEALVEDGGTIL
jgi:hypothetical protein